MKNMPDRPETWLGIIYAVCREHGLAVMLTFALSYMRIMFDDREPKPLRRLIEATLGALIVLTVGLTVERFGLSSGWAYFSAGFIGVLGVDQVRAFGRMWAERKAKGE
jgi:lambda family phage holin